MIWEWYQRRIIGGESWKVGEENWRLREKGKYTEEKIRFLSYKIQWSNSLIKSIWKWWRMQWLSTCCKNK